MNKKQIVIGFGILLLILFVFGIIFTEAIFTNDNTISEEKQNIEITEFQTDKNTYSSHEDLEISLQITSSRDIQATAKIKGIQPFNRAYIENSKEINLKEGENEITFNEKTPRCTSGCGGVSPGEYDISIEIWDDNEIIGSLTTTINLVS